MAQKKTEYTNESISALKGAERVRRKPSVIFGSDGLDGCTHAVFEILTNSIDEAREGYGKQIILTRFEDGSYQVEDSGRGCPVDWNARENCYNWELIFCELYAGSKYDNNDGGNYSSSLGTNGLGTCATQYTSEFMNVTVWRDGFKYTLHFEKGEIVGEMKKDPTDRGKRTGTTIHWKPDRTVFTDVDVPVEVLDEMLRRQSVVNGGVSFVFRNQLGGKFQTKEYLYEGGIQQFVSEVVGDTALTQPVFWQAERRGRDRADLPEYKLNMSVCLCFSNKTQLIEHYHNSSWLEQGGSPEKATRAAFVAAVDNYLRQQNKYQRNESKPSWDDIRDCLILVSNNFSTEASYANQTKKAVTNKFIQDAMTEFLRAQIEIYFIENPAEAQKIASQILINKRSRESAEKQRISTKVKLTGSMDISNRVQKFVDCRTKDVARRELYIVEGDSALGSVKQSRDPEFQGIMPVRGKILNCLKAELSRIFKSDIIMDLMKVLGCGVEVGEKRAKDVAAFDLRNLRWNKVIICTDADVDGFQIRTLILAMLHRLTPTLIREGYVYIAESPLYEITYKEKTWFAYSDKEKNDIVNGDLAGKKCVINRSKGLGENDPEMMALTTMSPATRRLIKVMPEDVENTNYVFDLLLGDDLAGRKTHIAENGYKYLEMADIS